MLDGAFALVNYLNRGGKFLTSLVIHITMRVWKGYA